MYPESSPYSSAFHLQEELAKGKTEAYKFLFRTYYARLLYFAMQKLHQRKVADEVVRKAFHSIWKNRTDLVTVQDIDSWLFTLVRHKISRYLSERSLWHVSTEGPGMDASLLDIESSHTGQGEESLHHRLTGILSQLPYICRTVVHLVRMEGFSIKQASQILNISEQATEAHLYDALEQMRNVVAEYGDRFHDSGSSDYQSNS